MRIQDARSAIHLLCEPGTVEAAEAVVMRIRHNAGEADQDEEAIALLRGFVHHLRAELRIGVRKRTGSVEREELDA